MGVLVDVALFAEVRNDAVAAPLRPMVALEFDLDILAVQVDGFIDVGRPLQRIADLRAAQGQHVMHGIGSVFGHPQGFKLREPGVHFGRGFSAGSHLEHHLDTINFNHLTGLININVRQNQTRAAAGGGHAQAAVDAATGIARQHGAVHVHRATAHGIAGDDIFAYGVLGEAFGRDDFHFAALDVGLVHNAAHAAVMVDMAVAVDHRVDRALAQMLADQIIGCLRGFRRNQRIEYDPSALRFNEGDVGQIVAPDLIDALGDLEQAVEHAQLGIAPQARVDRVRRRLVEADIRLVSFQIPDDIAFGIPDGQGFRGGDEAFLGVLEVLAVTERQRIQNLLVRGLGRRRGALGRG